MTVRRRSAGASLAVIAVLLGACRSGSDTSAPGTTAPADVGAPSTAPRGTTPPADSVVDGTTAVVGESQTGSTTTTAAPATQPEQSTTTLVVTLPDDVDADELVLTDGFTEDAETWSGATWDVDVPGEAVATVVDGVGIMETDARGTHEWVRAVAPGSTHGDATLTATITPIRSDEGTVFVGLHGDGEWRDTTPYLPQTGVVVEYSYAAVFLGEVVLIVLDGPEERRIGPVPGPILSDGDTANVRIEVVDGRARAKVWREGDDEPTGWAVEGDAASTDGGVVQISYRDGVAQSVAWDELTLLLK